MRRDVQLLLTIAHPGACPDDPTNQAAPPRAALLAPILSLSAALLAASGCGGEDVTIAQVSADVTEKVRKGQTKPVAKAQLLPPKNQQSQGRPY